MVEPISSSVVVKVADFRDATDSIFQLNRDFCACVGDAERAAWAVRARRTRTEVIGLVCKRATGGDMIRRESAIGRLDELLSKLA